MYDSYERKEKDIMAHENARAGYSKLFTAEVLSLIAALCSLLMLIPVVGTIIGGLASGVLLIIAYIMTLVGLNQAGKDEELVKSAFTLAIIGLILGIVGPIVGSIAGVTWVTSIVNLLNTIINLVIIHHVLYGAINLNSALSDNATSTWKIMLTVIILDIVVTIGLIITAFLGGSTAGGVVAIVVIVLTLVDVVLDVISYIKYLVFLNTAKKEV